MGIVRESAKQVLSFGGPPSDPLDLNLRALDIFIHIVDDGGMSAAARRLGLTQSAISQMVASLEHSLGVQLFDRQVRPLALTPSGIILLEKARALVRSGRDAIHAARQPSAATMPKLNLAFVRGIAGTVGPDLIAGIRGLAAHWSVNTGLSTQHNKALLSREADIIISPDPLEDEPGLERYEILKEPFFIAVPRSYEGRADSLPELAQSLDFVRFSSRTYVGRLVERHLRRLRIEAPGRIEIETADGVMAMVGGNVGWALITPLSVLNAPAYWPLIRFEAMAEPPLWRKMYVIARQGELGELPGLIADRAVAVLSCILKAKMRGPLPELADSIRMPPAVYVLAEKDCIACQTSDAPIAGVPPIVSLSRRSPSLASTPSGTPAHNS